MTVRDTADFWFDPTCPWAWMTSRWMEQVTKVRAVDVRWHIMSLSVLNEGRELDPDYQAKMDLAWGPARVVNAAQIEHGESYVKPLYDAIGTRLHPQDRRAGASRADYEQIMLEALEEVGLPVDLVKYADLDTYDDQLRRSHSEGISLVGEDVGTPIVAVNGVAFFGPVVSPAPKGEAAGRLWDGCLLVAGTDGFFELKRSRTRGPRFD